MEETNGKRRNEFEQNVFITVPSIVSNKMRIFIFTPLLARRSETIVKIANMTPLWYFSVAFWSHVKANYHWLLIHVSTRWGCSQRFWLKIMFAVKSGIDGWDKHRCVCISLEAEPQLFIQINHRRVCILGRWCVLWFYEVVFRSRKSCCYSVACSFVGGQLFSLNLCMYFVTDLKNYSFNLFLSLHHSSIMSISSKYVNDTQSKNLNFYRV